MPGVLPELICTDVAASLAFYRLLGFEVGYQRPQERFAYLELGDAHLMLEQPLIRERLHPRAPLERPYGRGINLSIDVEDVDAVHAAVVATGREVFLPLEERWYQRNQDEIGVRQFAVQDPDGYLLRLSEDLGTRPLQRHP